MMDINRNNYEAWLLDLMEGRLSPEEAREVRDFISLNPDCAVGMDDFEPMEFKAENLSFSGKSALHKEIPDHNSLVSEKDFDLYSIAMLEGDLSESQQVEFQKILDRDEEKMQEWLLWKQLKLSPEPILFQGKASLKKRVLPPSRLIWISIASAAAAVVLFFAIFRSDQDFSPTAPLSMETGSSTESPVEYATPESRGESAPDLTEGEEILMAEEAPGPGEDLKAKTAPLSLPDPEEIKEMETEEMETKENEPELRPIKLAVLEESLSRPPVSGTYDKIESQNLSAELGYADFPGENGYSEDGLKESYRTFLEEKDISLLSIASAGVDGINRLSGSDLKLNVARDDKGEVRGFRFRSALISVDSPVRKKKNLQ